MEKRQRISSRLPRAGIILTVLVLLCCLVPAALRQNDDRTAGPQQRQQKIGVLLVNHGSRSTTWRQALLDLGESVIEPICAGGTVRGIKTAFMEYTEPSIATRLKEFDGEGFTDVIIVPVFLTVSPHSFDDIPTIIGQKEDPRSMEVLKIEKIERYTPKARAWITPLLDFTDVLQTNVLNRVKRLSNNPAEEGLVLIAYGDHTYTDEWSALLNNVAEHVKRHTGISGYSHGWCGHVARYRPEATTAAIEQVLASSKTALVVPVLVARDEMFQVKIIGDGIAKIPDAKQRVRYKPDAILPDPNIEKWVVDIARTYADKVQKNGGSN